MTKENGRHFTVVSNSKLEQEESLDIIKQGSPSDYNYQTNPLYQKLLNFRNFQNEQKKRFSVDDLFKLC